MISGWFVMLALALAACATPVEPTADVQPLRAMTFNIRYDNPGDGEDAWPKRREAVATLIRFYAPDVLGLQEVLLRQRDQMMADIPGYAFLGVGRDDGRSAGEFAPLAYRTDRFDLVEQGHFWLSDTPDRPQAGWDAALPRIATWARLTDRTTGARLLVLNTHFDHRGEAARRNSAIQIRDWLAAERNGCERLVVLGDFNARPSQQPYLSITAGDPPVLADARRLSETPPFGPPGTATAFDILRADEEPIDYIFVEPGTRVIRFGVLTQHDGGRLPSDHYPVVADLAPAPCAVRSAP